MVRFDHAEFTGGRVSFNGAVFSGGRVTFSDAEFPGGRVDFSSPRDWSIPPTFPWTDKLPPGVTLPGRIEPAGGGPSRP
jgi:hypothetical protein